MKTKLPKLPTVTVNRSRVTLVTYIWAHGPATAMALLHALVRETPGIKTDKLADRYLCRAWADGVLVHTGVVDYEVAPGVVLKHGKTPRVLLGPDSVTLAATRHQDV